MKKQFGLILTLILSFSFVATAYAGNYTMSFMYGGTNHQYDNYISRTNNILDTVSPDYLKLSSEGNLETQKIDKDFIIKNHANDINVIPFISNHWDKSVAISALNNSRNLASQIGKTMSENNLDGIVIDFNNLTVQYKNDFIEFLKEVKNVLPSHKNLMVTVCADPNEENTGIHGSYDYSSIGEIADYVILMCFDEFHNKNEPGVIASNEFVEKSIGSVTNHIPNEKIILGIPFYGRYWKNGDNSNGNGITNMDIQTLLKNYKSEKEINEENGTCKATIHIDSGDVEPKLWGGAVLTNGTYEVWYDDESNTHNKISLADKYNLKGVATWSLGQENRAIWSSFNKSDFEMVDDVSQVSLSLNKSINDNSLNDADLNKFVYEDEFVYDAPIYSEEEQAEIAEKVIKSWKTEEKTDNQNNKSRVETITIEVQDDNYSQDINYNNQDSNYNAQENNNNNETPANTDVNNNTNGIIMNGNKPMDKNIYENPVQDKNNLNSNNLYDNVENYYPEDINEYRESQTIHDNGTGTSDRNNMNTNNTNNMNDVNTNNNSAGNNNNNLNRNSNDVLNKGANPSSDIQNNSGVRNQISENATENNYVLAENEVITNDSLNITDENTNTDIEPETPDNNTNDMSNSVQENNREFDKNKLNINSTSDDIKLNKKNALENIEPDINNEISLIDKNILSDEVESDTDESTPIDKNILNDEVESSIDENTPIDKNNLNNEPVPEENRETKRSMFEEGIFNEEPNTETDEINNQTPAFPINENNNEESVIEYNKNINSLIRNESNEFIKTRDELFDKGYISEDEYYSNDYITKSQAVKSIMRIANYPGINSSNYFTDMLGHPDKEYVEKAKHYGVIKSEGDVFNPDDNITKADVILMLENVFDLPNTVNFHNETIKDINKFGNKDLYYTVNKFYELGIIRTDSGNHFNPESFMSTDEFVEILGRLKDEKVKDYSNSKVTALLPR